MAIVDPTVQADQNTCAQTIQTDIGDIMIIAYSSTESVSEHKEMLHCLIARLLYEQHLRSLRSSVSP